MRVRAWGADNAVRLVIALSLAACGGCPDGNTNPNGEGIPGTPVSNAQRTQVIDAVSSTLSGLSADEPAAARDALVAMLKKSTAIEAAGVSEDGGVWARFTDNRLLLVVMNSFGPQNEDSSKPIVPDDAESPMRSPLPATKTSPRAKSDAGPRSLDQLVSLPASTDCFLFNTYGDDLEGVESHLDNLAFWLDVRGYVEKTAGSRLATIENYMKVKNAGLVYVQGHGTIGFIRETDDPESATIPIFGLGTLTPRAADGSTDAQYEDMLKSHQLGYLVTPDIFRSPIDQVRRFRPVAARGYFITKNFVLEHWTFKPGAWVYLDVCHGFDLLFKDACFEKGAGVFQGWSLSARHLDTIETSEYLFSRVLGISSLANAKFAKSVSPPQRAFSLFDVLNHMELKNRTNPPFLPIIEDTLLESTDIHNVPEILSSAGKAELVLELASNVAEPILVPTISQLFIGDQPSIVHDEPNILTINGSFGFEEPIVLIGGAESGEILSRTSGSIVCRIGPEDYGEVAIKVAGRYSAYRMLTRWIGTASAAVFHEDGPAEQLTLGVSFRGDVQSYRYFPDENPRYTQTPTFDAIPVVSSVQSASVTGSSPCDQGQTGAGYTWSTIGSNDVPVKRAGSEGDYFWFQKGGTGFTVTPEGVIEGSVAYGIYRQAGVRETGDCTPLSPFDRTTFMSISGGTEVKMSPGSYDISEIAEETIGDVQYLYGVDMSAVGIPGDDDPR